MMAGLSAHAAVQAVTGLSVDLKWPNDLLVHGRKVGGILTEMHAEPTQVRFVNCGDRPQREPGEISSGLGGDLYLAADGNGKEAIAAGSAGATAATI